MPFWLLSLIYFFFLSFVLSVWAALGNNAALASLIIMTALLLLIYKTSSLDIEVDQFELKIGRAHIERKYLGEALILDNTQMRRIRTQDADPSAYLAIRFWASTGVKLMINDKRDETPYWLISSNKANQLAQALNKN